MVFSLLGFMYRVSPKNHQSTITAAATATAIAAAIATAITTTTAITTRHERHDGRGLMGTTLGTCNSKTGGGALGFRVRLVPFYSLFDLLFWLQKTTARLHEQKITTNTT